MNKIAYIITSILVINTISAQEAFHNFGNVQIHNQGQVGFHTDLINDGTFDQNVGFTGFYNQNGRLTVSGNNQPIFYDVAIDVIDDLFLEVGVGVANFEQFVSGRVQTPRDQKDIALNYINDAPYMDENDARYVDGYASMTGVLDFTFPIGDDFRLRPMRIENGASADTAKGAYYFEDPNTPNFFSGSFDTDNFDNLLYGVSKFEFWDLDGTTETRVTLTWDDNSNIPTLVDDLQNLRVVGWDKTLNQWVNLGNTSFTGDLNNGEITSDLILPDNYEVLTFGSSEILLDGDLQIFTGVSPNGDGDNDTFTIQGIEAFPDNELSIFNRWGVEVYHRKGYDNSWGGISEGRATIAKGEELPVGTYYYVLKLGSGQKDRAGYLYITR